MALKMVLFYNQFQRGFTETWYLPGTNPPSVLPPGVDNMMKKAIKFRGAGTVLTGARFTQVGARQTTTFRFGGKYSADNQSNYQPSVAEDVVSTSLVWRLSDNTFHSKLMYLRGLQDNDVVRDAVTGVDVPSAVLKQNLAAYLQAAIAAGMQLRYQKTPSNTPGFLQYPILSIDKDATNDKQSILTMGLSTLPDIDTNTIFGVIGIKKNDCPGIPKTSKAVLVNGGVPATITMSYRFRNQAIVRPVGAFAYKVDFVYQNLAIEEFIEFSEHKTGRPFFQPRGRASVALRRQ